MHRSNLPLRRLARASAATAVALVLAAACSSSDAAPPTTSTTSASATPTISSTTSTTTTSTTTTSTTVLSTLPDGQELALELVDGELRFTITIDTAASTAQFLVAPLDGSAGPRWESVVPVDDVPNASGHRPFDGLVPVGDIDDTATEEANRALVSDYVRTALVDGRWEDVDRFFRNGEYRLHGPLFADGLESVQSFFIGLRDAGAPFVISDTAVLLADGPYVLAINRNDRGGAATAYWDLWRVDSGAIVEHWDATQTITEPGVDAWFEGIAP